MELDWNQKHDTCTGIGTKVKHLVSVNLSTLYKPQQYVNGYKRVGNDTFVILTYCERGMMSYHEAIVVL